MLPFPIISNTNILPAPEHIIQTDGSSSHIGVLYSDGSLYLRGSNTSGALGTGNNIDSYDKFVLVRTDVKLFFCGSNITFIQTFDNRWYFSGTRSLISAGGSYSSTFTDITDRLNSEILEGSIKIKKISTSNLSTLILTTEGNLYACGNNTYGETGLGSGFQSVFKLTNTNVIDISNCRFSSYAVKSNGELYSVGSNENGYLGINDSNVSSTNIIYTWTKCVINSEHEYVSSVRGSFNSVMIISGASINSDKKLYSCGINTSSQLGIGNSTSPIISFTACIMPESSSIISLGTGGTSMSRTVHFSTGIYSTGSAGSPSSGILSNSSVFIPISSVSLPSSANIKFNTTCGIGVDSYGLIIYKDGSKTNLYEAGSAKWMNGTTKSTYTLNNIIK